MLHGRSSVDKDTTYSFVWMVIGVMLNRSERASAAGKPSVNSQPCSRTWMILMLRPEMIRARFLIRKISCLSIVSNEDAFRTADWLVPRIVTYHCNISPSDTVFV